MEQRTVTNASEWRRRQFERLPLDRRTQIVVDEALERLAARFAVLLRAHPTHTNDRGES